MGANAQTSVPAFTAGQVLTAQQQTEINTGIPVFATTTTRDAAFGGTGEKVLAEGQFAYIEASNTTQYYDGAAWQSVGTTPGLIYLTGASFSAVTSVSLPNSTFTTTYDYYKIFVRVSSTSAGGSLGMRFRTSGTDNTNDNYRSASFGIYSQGTTANTNQDAGNTSFLQFTESNIDASHTEITLSQPASTVSTFLTLTSMYNRSNSPYHGYRTYGGVFTANTAFDAATFLCSTGNMTGFYKVYGVSNS